MSCDRCQDLCAFISISSPFELKQALRVVRDNLADHTIRIVAGELPAGESISDGIECSLECTTCQHQFALLLGPDGKGGGSWVPSESPKERQRAAKARRKDRIASFPKPGSVKRVTPAALRRKIERAGLGQRADDLLALARPCVQLEPAPCKPADLGPGLSRIGGEPYLPADFAWPEFDGVPLDFLCQLYLDKLPDGVLPELPRSGLLSFFYRVADNPWGNEPGDAGSAVVHYHDASAGGPLSRYEADSASDDEPDCHGVKFVPGVQLPSGLDPVIEQLTGGELTGDDADRYFDFAQQLVCDHHLMGYPDLLQGHDMRADCAANTPDAGLRGSAGSWRLLLQLGGDTHPLGLPWDGSGRIYFWILEQDLAARRFDRCWLTFQVD